MARDPFSAIPDAPLFIVPRVLESLRAYRAAPPPAGRDPRLQAHLDGLAERLLAGIAAHPTRFWAMKQFQRTLAALERDQPQARSELDTELRRLMAILGMDAADASLNC